MSFDDLRRIGCHAVTSVYPTSLIRPLVKLCQNEVDGYRIVTVQGQNFRMDPERGCHVVGCGKAVMGMAAELNRILGDNIQSGILSVPIGICSDLESSNQIDQILPPDSKIRVFEGAKNNLPDKTALETGRAITALVSSLDEKDLLFILVSGGGSALLPAPTSPLTLEDKLDVIKALSHSGATIQELNTVRISLSDVKGGKLARHAFPAQVVGLILSDIIGDPLDLIGGAPTVTTKEVSIEKAALSILQKFGVNNEKVFQLLSQKQTSGQVEDSSRLLNVLIGNNEIALNSARKLAKEMGFYTIYLSNQIRGEARHIGEIFAELSANALSKNVDKIRKCLRHLCARESDLQQIESEITIAIKELDELNQPICFIGGGETVVNVIGSGKGGRNQEMVLSAAIALDSPDFKDHDVIFLSLGTDGIDGPTDVAGAVADQCLLQVARLEGIKNAVQYLLDNNSYEFFSCLKGGQNFIKIGHTGTNVMDIQLLVIRPKISKMHAFGAKEM